MGGLRDILPRAVEPTRIARTVIEASAGRRYDVVNLSDPVEVDDIVGDWLTESYHAETRGTRRR